MLLPSAVAAARFGAAPALTDETGTLSFAAWDAAATALASRWRREHGLSPAPRVALWAGNGLAWAVAAAAVWRLGGALVPLSTRWTPAEAGAALEALGVELLVADAPRLEPAGALADAGGFALAPLPAPATGTPSGPSGPPPALALETPMSYLFTSGTTGAPKIVPLRWSQQQAGAVALNRALGATPADHWDLGLPLFHVGGLNVLMRLWLSGAQATIPPRFDAADLLARAEAGRVTIASLVPQTLDRVLEALGDRPWPAAWRVALVGGAAASPEALARCPVARHTYGLTEACAAVTLEPAAPSGPRSAGLPLGETRVRIQDASGAVLPAGAEGLIALRGPSVFAGYHRAPEANAARFSAGFFLTGDWGRLGPDGALTVLARREDLIVSGGENIYPAEVEAALAAHPAIREAAVLPRADARWGQVPVAAVALRPGEPAPSLEEISAFLAPRLARFKHPAALVVLPALPRLPNAKLDRRALLAELAP